MKRRKVKGKNTSYLLLLLIVLGITGYLITTDFFKSGLWWPYFLAVVIIVSLLRIISRAGR